MAESDFNPLSLIAAPITGAFDLAGGKAQADAAKEGARLQHDSVQQALDFTKALKAKQEAAAAPYLSLGGMAVGRLPNVAARGPVGGPPMPYGAPQAQRPMMAAPMGQMGQSPQPGGMVMVQAPTGETRQLPHALAQQAVARGAKIVG